MATSSFHAVVYGPLKTRRLGISLGINPVPSSRESCPPDCVHCLTGVPDSVPIISRANQMPSAGIVVTSAARRIIELSKASEKLDSITVAGDGDPLKHPSLLEITENLRDLRNKWFAKADLCLLSDSVALEAPDLRHVLTIYDKPILRFEWGTVKSFTALTGRSSADFKRLNEQMGALERLILQATFVQGDPDNSTDNEVKAWLKHLEELRPREVQLMTIEAKGGRKTGSKPVPVSKLEEIAAKVTEKLGIPASIVAREAQPV